METKVCDSRISRCRPSTLQTARAGSWPSATVVSLGCMEQRPSTWSSRCRSGMSPASSCFCLRPSSLSRLTASSCWWTYLSSDLWIDAASFLRWASWANRCSCGSRGAGGGGDSGEGRGGEGRGEGAGGTRGPGVPNRGLAFLLCFSTCFSFTFSFLSLAPRSRSASSWLLHDLACSKTSARVIHPWATTSCRRSSSTSMATYRSASPAAPPRWSGRTMMSMSPSSGDIISRSMRSPMRPLASDPSTRSRTSFPCRAKARSTAGITKRRASRSCGARRGCGEEGSRQVRDSRGRGAAGGAGHGGRATGGGSPA